MLLLQALYLSLSIGQGFLGKLQGVLLLLHLQLLLVDCSIVLQLQPLLQHVLQQMEAFAMLPSQAVWLRMLPSCLNASVCTATSLCSSMC